MLRPFFDKMGGVIYSKVSSVITYIRRLCVHTYSEYWVCDTILNSERDILLTCLKICEVSQQSEPEEFYQSR